MTSHRRRTYDRVLTVAGVLDRCPLAPARLADRALARFHARRRRRAAGDLTWAEIEARRRRGNHPSVVFLSDDLTLADWETQRRIADELTPRPRWWGAARTVATWTATRGVAHLAGRAQRARRGWADVDAVDAGRHLARVTAGLLGALAADGQSWPVGRYETLEAWQAELRSRAGALRSFADGGDPHDLTGTWYRLAADASSDPAAVAEARRARDVGERRSTEEAQAALRWVADHLDTLWG